MKHYRSVFFLITGLFMYLLIDYLPLMAGSSVDHLQSMLGSREDYLTVENWEESYNELLLKKQFLDAEITRYALDLPTETKSSQMVEVINTIAAKNKIRTFSYTFKDYEQKGNYLYWPIVAKFEAHYREGIRFIHALETHKKLIRIQSVTITNKENLENQPIEFETVIEMVLVRKQ